MSTENLEDFYPSSKLDDIGYVDDSDGEDDVDDGAAVINLQPLSRSISKTVSNLDQVKGLQRIPSRSLTPESYSSDTALSPKAGNMSPGLFRGQDEWFSATTSLRNPEINSRILQARLQAQKYKTANNLSSEQLIPPRASPQSLSPVAAKAGMGVAAQSFENLEEPLSAAPPQPYSALRSPRIDSQSQMSPRAQSSEVPKTSPTASGKGTYIFRNRSRSPTLNSSSQDDIGPAPLGRKLSPPSSSARLIPMSVQSPGGAAVAVVAAAAAVGSAVTNTVAVSAPPQLTPAVHKSPAPPEVDLPIGTSTAASANTPITTSFSRQNSDSTTEHNSMPRESDSLSDAANGSNKLADRSRGLTIDLDKPVAMALQTTPPSSARTRLRESTQDILRTSSGDSRKSTPRATMTTHDVARKLLLERLSRGMPVSIINTKGRWQRKIMNCDAAVSMLIAVPDEVVDDDDLSESTILSIAEMRDIRLGSELDPRTPPEVLIEAATNHLITQSQLAQALELQSKCTDISNALSAKKKKKKSSGLLDTLFGGSASPSPELQFGSEELRSFCPEDQMGLAFTIYLTNKTFNIVCSFKKDFDVLVNNLKALIAPAVVTSVTTQMSRMQGFSNNPLRTALERKKSRGNTDDPTADFADNDLESTTSSATLLPQKIHPIHGGFRRSFAEFYDAIDTSLIEPVLSEQDRLFGVNMYTSLRPGDETVIESYLVRGLTLDMALRRLFSKRYEGFMPPNPPAQVKETAHSTAGLVFTKALFSDIQAKDIMKLGMTLLRQEQEYGVNMFNSMAPEDDSMYQNYLNNGLLPEWAAMEIFQTKISEGKIVPKDHQLAEMMTGVPRSYGDPAVASMYPPFQQTMANMQTNIHPNIPSLNFAQGSNPYYPTSGPVPGGYFPSEQFSTPSQPPGPRSRPPPSYMQTSMAHMQSTAPMHATYDGQHSQAQPHQIHMAVSSPPPVAVEHPGPSPRQMTKKRESMWGSFFGGSSADPRCNPADVQRITEMGFTEDQAVSSLLMNDNNLARAIDSLMSYC